jgi:hypothetical protein
MGRYYIQVVSTVEVPNLKRIVKLLTGAILDGRALADQGEGEVCHQTIEERPEGRPGIGMHSRIGSSGHHWHHN